MLVLLMLQLFTISTLTLSEHDVSQQQSVLSLLAIQNREDSEGVEITIFTNINNSTVVFEEYKSIHIPGRSLSSEYGDRYFRYQDDIILVETLLLQDDRELEIIFVPLGDGILFLSRWCDSNSQTVAVCTWNTFLLNCSNCSPTVIYKIGGNFYTVCISSAHHFVAVYEVRLHLAGSIIDSVTLLGPLTNINIPNYSLSTSRLSNFILVEHMVYFAVGNTIFVMDVFDLTQTQQYPELSTCTQIHNLVPIIGNGNQQLLVAYCTDRYIYFDPVYGDWTTMRTFSMYGVPYLCPSDNYKVTLFINRTNEGDYLQFSIQDSSPKIIRNVNISSGICFKSQNRTYFAYSDQQHISVFVYDFITQNHYPVSRFNMEHPQLLLLENQYMVIRDTRIFVLDAGSNFSLVMNLTLEMTNGLFTVLSHVISNDMPTVVPTDVQTNMPNNNIPTSLPTDMSTNTDPIDMHVSTTEHDVPGTAVHVGTTNHIVATTEQPESTNEDKLQLALISVGSIAALIVVINIIVITVYSFKRCQKNNR